MYNVLLIMCINDIKYVIIIWNDNNINIIIII